MISLDKIFLESRNNPMDANIRKAYSIENAAWIWHPDCGAAEEAMLRFRNTFELEAETTLTMHISADQRYELHINGTLVSIGPDRGDIEHWSFASYRLTLPAGQNIIEAAVWWIGSKAPKAQLSRRGGFIFCAEGEYGALLDTGRGGWMVARREGCRFAEPLPPKFVGYCQEVDGDLFFKSGNFVKPSVIEGPIDHIPYGIKRDMWALYPTSLPDQTLRETRTGKVKAFFPEGLAPDTVVTPEAMDNEGVKRSQALIDGKEMIIAPYSTVAFLLDLDQYYCAYAVVGVSGGKGAQVSVQWSESLFTETGSRADKGNRDTVEGKYFCGTGDGFSTDGGERVFRPCWWRAGRYLLVTMTTQEQSLTLNDFHLLETRYPLEMESEFRCDSAVMETIRPLLVRGMQMCSHETYMDCPYYEQLMYVGDTRIEMLVNYIMSGDDRLVKRGIQLFDWSRRHWGVVKEHYPGADHQLSLTFAMIYVRMVADFARWRDEPAWVKKRLPGVRGNLERIREFRNSDGLLANLAGWSFVDWVPAWNTGYAPDGAGVSSINNLFFLMALKASAFLEQEFGDPLLAERDARDAAALSRAILAAFHDEERGLLADDIGHRCFSEHAQCLALLNDLYEGDRERTVFRNLVSDPDLSRTTIYFSFYLLETLYKYGRGDLIVPRFEFWNATVKNGLKTPVEMPEPTRSDCHAWGSHPLFHYFASIAGIRPDAPGFREIVIAPSPGNLCEIACRCPHPRGIIDVNLRFASNGGCRGAVRIPTESRGTFHWHGDSITLKPGEETAFAFPIA